MTAYATKLSSYPDTVMNRLVPAVLDVYDWEDRKCRSIRYAFRDATIRRLMESPDLDLTSWMKKVWEADLQSLEVSDVISRVRLLWGQKPAISAHLVPDAQVVSLGSNTVSRAFLRQATAEGSGSQKKWTEGWLDAALYNELQYTDSKDEESVKTLSKFIWTIICNSEGGDFQRKKSLIQRTVHYQNPLIRSQIHNTLFHHFEIDGKWQMWMTLQLRSMLTGIQNGEAAGLLELVLKLCGQDKDTAATVISICAEQSDDGGFLHKLHLEGVVANVEHHTFLHILQGFDSPLSSNRMRPHQYQSWKWHLNFYWFICYLASSMRTPAFDKIANSFWPLFSEEHAALLSELFHKPPAVEDESTQRTWKGGLAASYCINYITKLGSFQVDQLAGNMVEILLEIETEGYSIIGQDTFRTLLAGDSDRDSSQDSDAEVEDNQLISEPLALSIRSIEDTNVPSEDTDVPNTIL